MTARKGEQSEPSEVPSEVSASDFLAGSEAPLSVDPEPELPSPAPDPTHLPPFDPYHGPPGCPLAVKRDRVRGEPRERTGELPSEGPTGS